MKMNGYLKLFRSDLVALGAVSDREFRYYIMSRGACVWDKRNQLAGTFDARTEQVKQHILPMWSTGKINMTKNALLQRGLYQKTGDARRLRIVDMRNIEHTRGAAENAPQAAEGKVQGRELTFQEREERMRRIRDKLFKKPSALAPE